MTSRFDSCAASAGIHSVYRPISALTHPLTERVLAFWRDRPVDGIVIGRDVPSRVIAPLLSRIIVHEPIDGDRDLKVRVAGGGIVRRLGTDITGKTMSELFPTPDFTERRESVLKAIREGTPQFADCILSAGKVEMLHTELVILPVYAPNHIDVWGMTVCCFFN
jgi:PAS domain